MVTHKKHFDDLFLLGIQKGRKTIGHWTIARTIGRHTGPYKEVSHPTNISKQRNAIKNCNNIFYTKRFVGFEKRV